MTPEQLAQALAAQNAQLTHAMAGMKEMMAGMKELLGGTVKAEGRGDGKIVGKHFRSDVFTGEQTKWDDWSFAFKRCVRSMSPETFKAMIEGETNVDAISEDVELTAEMERRSAELYDVLCQYCTGEALMIVRSVDDMQGISAWQKLFQKYNPKTMARGLRVLVEVVNPPKAKGIHDVELAVAKWEEKSKILATQFGEKLSDRMKMGILTSIMPIAIQDYIYTHVEKDSGYEDLKEKVRSMVSNKVAADMGPAPMDIGDVKGQADEWGNEYENQYEGDREVDVVYGDYRCRNCGGYGHFARECPSKGKAKAREETRGREKDFPREEPRRETDGAPRAREKDSERRPSDTERRARGKPRTTKERGRGTRGRVGVAGRWATTRASAQPGTPGTWRKRRRGRRAWRWKACGTCRT